MSLDNILSFMPWPYKNIKFVFSHYSTHNLKIKTFAKLLQDYSIANTVSRPFAMTLDP